MNKTTRHQERIWALKLLYSLDLIGFLKWEEACIRIRRFKLEEGLSEEKYYFQELIKGVISNIGELDQEIGEKAIDWKVDRMSFIDRNILRLALYEMKNGVPIGVAINEAVELAKEYSDSKSASFVNGILARKD
ncbi:MAG TPA: transcription antitermination factor NusB [Halanaerobiales bacterium]|nr:transcription antitermination factor NusB [Halanaerobiales bacterium]